VTQPLAVAFVWHMHQPYYRMSREGPFEMPWARMHALKDYADMVDILDAYPGLHQTFNLVPSLVEQLESYALGDFADVYWQHTVSPADQLTEAERVFVVDMMCPSSEFPRVRRSPRYLELARKKEAAGPRGIDACAAEFSTGEIRDIQVWFNLAWFDPVYTSEGPLADLVSRDRDFTEGDKEPLAREQARILRNTLSTYRRASQEGRIELTTSPYFHPILPLLVNSDSARIARGDITLPLRRFAHPEDAREQVLRALAKHEQVFGVRPRGMWCSEQAVGEDVVPLLTATGLTWTISDEGVLARSLRIDLPRSDEGHLLDPKVLYRPYRLNREGSSLDIVFRDRVLSDLLGFTYQTWAPQDAAANLIWRLREARRNLAGTDEAHLVTIALDGENAWEYYSRDGHDLLAHLYEGLSNDPGFRCVTVGEFLAEHEPVHELPWLHTGSWINADLSTWMGDPAHGPAWDLLHEARDFVAADRDHLPEIREEAWRHILVAEGSDWFWWFSEHQESGVDYLWDLNFRRHLQQAYRVLGQSPPPDLFAPILTQGPGSEAQEPAGAFTPVIDGMISQPQEWSMAGLRRAPRGGAMHRAEDLILDEVRYGADEHNLYLLFRPGPAGLSAGTVVATYFSNHAGRPPADHDTGSTDRIRFHGQTRGDTEMGFPLTRELLVQVEGPGRASASLGLPDQGRWTVGTPMREAALGDVLEVALPLRALDPERTGGFRFVVAVGRGGLLLQLIPSRGAVTLLLPAG
jgi:alpha-amylase/alpha-mannosidase (GH57 family)